MDSGREHIIPFLRPRGIPTMEENSGASPEDWSDSGDEDDNTGEKLDMSGL